MHTHYTAPITALVLTIVLQATRHLHEWQWQGWPIGRWLARASIALFFVAAVTIYLNLMWAESLDSSDQRAQIVSSLKQTGGKHLILVRHHPRHTDSEWVYNEAGIDRSAVVWAHEMDAAQNRQLLSYFHDRRAWLLDTGAKSLKLIPYSLSQSPN
jgi:hypothetical protein